MSRAVSPRIDESEAGFTVIEVLIALAIVAVSIVAIASVMSANARGVQSMGEHVALVQSARRIMNAQIPLRKELGPGALSGAIDGYQWRIEISPMSDWIAPDTDAPFVPHLVKIRVRSASGAEYDLQTVRLVGTPRQ
ncbi:prepilin-type N-terminal cleavage/methylation domain-containing protein [Bradyrhizobium sp. BR13661]|uniref:PulJ/GspJ family protein n=1 Tax=Bradyrhizobium sp. BR13661 TaxID=2940622 RepID=UPI002475792E|nr:prepilin-type N-terminal cleavage/methylation domain-containing protein [Bradyrhizobium sp. BR13661]MDH6258173.1 general secretion pathway protein I [Bradyrhizobium sp. BR13661]